MCLIIKHICNFLRSAFRHQPSDILRIREPSLGPVPWSRCPLVQFELFANHFIPHLDNIIARLCLLNALIFSRE